MRDKIETVVRRVWEQVLEVEVWIRETVADDGQIQAQSDAEVVRDVVRSIDFREGEGILPLSFLVDDDAGRKDCLGTTGDGEWRRVRKWITLDLGSAAFVMPEKWLPRFEKRPSAGSAKGQKFAGATAKVAPNIGEKTIEFRTSGGHDRRGTVQPSDVNEILACVAGIADGPGPGEENLLIGSSKGVVITHEDRTKIIMAKGLSVVANFDRQGDVYVMDTWVRKKKAVAKTDKKDTHDQRQGRRCCRNGIHCCLPYVPKMRRVGVQMNVIFRGL